MFVLHRRVLELKILGLTVQDDLKWNLHVDISIKKAAKIETIFLG